MTDNSNVTDKYQLLVIPGFIDSAKRDPLTVHKIALVAVYVFLVALSTLHLIPIGSSSFHKNVDTVPDCCCADDLIE
jgi:hypothetical protein